MQALYLFATDRAAAYFWAVLPLFHSWRRTPMKKMIVLIAAMTLLSLSVGCSGSGLLSQFKSRCSGGCQTPPVNPSFGYPAGDCNSSAAEGEFIGGGQVIDAGNSTSYMNDGYIQSDPYMSGSNSGGATINPPVFDSYSGPSYGSTIGPPASSGNLPAPPIGN